MYGKVMGYMDCFFQMCSNKNFLKLGNPHALCTRNPLSLGRLEYAKGWAANRDKTVTALLTGK